jgi:hypothetical protein
MLTSNVAVCRSWLALTYVRLSTHGLTHVLHGLTYVLHRQVSPLSSKETKEVLPVKLALVDDKSAADPARADLPVCCF